VGPSSIRHGASSGCGWREDLHIRRVAANILDKQSWTADKKWSSSLVVGHEDNDPNRKNFYCNEIFQSASNLD
jgi:hypothetical protein